MSRDINQGIDPSMQYLNSGFRGNSVDTQLTRMVGQEVRGKKQFCSECGVACDVAYTQPNAPKDVPSVYCKQHYEELFANRCEACSQPIMGKYVNVYGKKYHEHCQGQNSPCAACGQRISGEAIAACNTTWHPNCFKCTQCFNLLGTGAFVEKDGLPLCRKCGNEARAQANSTQYITETNTVDLRQNQKVNNNKAKADMNRNVDQGKAFCGECGRAIMPNDSAVSHGPSVFHSACFVCAKCGCELVDVGFRLVDGHPHCSRCAPSGGGGGFCGGCGQQLVGQYVSAMGQKWHKECFVCSACQKPFTGGYAEKDGMPFCGPCVQKNAKPTVTTKYVGQRTGFTVDPRSGKKTYT